jgi:hypothetical protein
VYDWERNPYSESSAQPENLTSREEEQLCELQPTHTLNMRFTDSSLEKSWISVIEEYPAIHPFTGKQYSDCCSFPLYACVSKVFLV